MSAVADGLAVSDGGSALEPVDRRLPAGERTPSRFRIVGADREPLRASAGRHRLVLQFRAGGAVRTAAFTVEVGR